MLLYERHQFEQQKGESLMKTIHDLGWWYWFPTVGLLGAWLSALVIGIYLATEHDR
jgi:hypothetical protein